MNSVRIVSPRMMMLQTLFLLIRILMMTRIKPLAALALALSCALGSADTLNSISINDPELGNRTIEYEKIDQFAVIEGDIIIGRVNNISGQGAVITRKISGSRWKDGIVPFQIAENLPLMNKLAVLQAIAHWQKYTPVEFVEITSNNQPFYHDYISFIPAEGTTCSSYVGKMGGKQEINLSPRCTTMNTVHEIGHALGLWHEQSRADRDSFIRIIWENIEDEHRHNFEQHLTDGKDYGSYDYQSIMHYGPYAFSKNGEKTIVPLIEGIQIGQRNQLSEKDIAVITAMYPDV